MTKFATKYRAAPIPFVACLCLISLIGDGGPQKSAGLHHQLLILPATLLFLFGLYSLVSGKLFPSGLWSVRRALLLCALFEVAACGLFFYQAHHFAAVGYRLHLAPAVLWYAAATGALVWIAFRENRTAGQIFLTTISIYAGGMLLAIYSFPLTYLRSDMLPVIRWAGSNLLHHINPYATIYVDHRVYNFPYLPGMIVAYLPFIAAHIDLRFAALLFNLLSAVILYRVTKSEDRCTVTTLMALFFLSPFLQYRHELYIAPHWLTLIAGFVLLYRKHDLWAALVFGISAAVYQFTWLIIPFVLLNTYRERGWREATKNAAVMCAGALLILGPFLHHAASRIFSDTVTDWGEAAHADAMPMNLSYWITYFVPPSQLLYLQATLMIAIFAVALFKRRCATLEDTLRFGIIALTVFILCNVLVDGYFYLMLLVVMLCYLCVANQWWSLPRTAER